MTTSLPEAAYPLLDEPYYATITTVEPDGAPQVTAVWVKRDGDETLISTVRGRRKEHNLQRDDHATVFVMDPDDPWHYLEVRGRVHLQDDPERELIEELSHKYLGAPYPTEDPDMRRVIVRIRPERVRYSAGR